jgi:hypothetical protein
VRRLARRVAQQLRGDAFHHLGDRQVAILDPSPSKVPRRALNVATAAAEVVRLLREDRGFVGQGLDLSAGCRLSGIKLDFTAKSRALMFKRTKHPERSHFPFRSLQRLRPNSASARSDSSLQIESRRKTGQATQSLSSRSN